MSDPTPKRRWFRFSLWTLFVVVTLLAFTLPPLVKQYESWKAQRDFDALIDEIVKTVRPSTGNIIDTPETEFYDSEGDPPRLP